MLGNRETKLAKISQTITIYCRSPSCPGCANPLQVRLCSSGLPRASKKSALNYRLRDNSGVDIGRSTLSRPIELFGLAKHNASRDYS